MIHRDGVFGQEFINQKLALMRPEFENYYEEPEFENCYEDTPVAEQNTDSLGLLYAEEQQCAAQQELEALRKTTSEALKNASDLEASSLETQGRLQKLRDECQALWQKREATDEELADRIRQSQLFATKLQATEDRQRAELAQLRQREAAAKEAFSELQAKESELHTMEAQLLVEFEELSTMRSHSKEDLKTCSALLTRTTHQDINDIKDIHLTFLASKSTISCTLRELQRQRVDIITRFAGCRARMEKWETLRSSYHKRAEEHEMQTAELDFACGKATQEANALYSKVIALPGGDAFGGHMDLARVQRAACLEAAQDSIVRALRLRRVAGFAPILASWLTSLWWLVVWPNLHR